MPVTTKKYGKDLLPGDIVAGHKNPIQQVIGHDEDTWLVIEGSTATHNGGWFFLNADDQINVTTEAWYDLTKDKRDSIEGHFMPGFHIAVDGDGDKTLEQLWVWATQAVELEREDLWAERRWEEDPTSTVPFEMTPEQEIESSQLAVRRVKAAYEMIMYGDTSIEATVSR